MLYINETMNTPKMISLTQYKVSYLKAREDLLNEIVDSDLDQLEKLKLIKEFNIFNSKNLVRTETPFYDKIPPWKESLRGSVLKEYLECIDTVLNRGYSIGANVDILRCLERALVYMKEPRNKNKGLPILDQVVGSYPALKCIPYKEYLDYLYQWCLKNQCISYVRIS